MSRLKTYVGVADCHGVESFLRKDTLSSFEQACQMLRANANPHRHAIYYEVSIEGEHIGVVEAYLKAKQYGNALECLKRVATEFSTLPEHADHIPLIPNPALDPYA